MKIALVNAFYPPDTAVTGQSLSELYDELIRHPELEIKIFSSTSISSSYTKNNGEFRTVSYSNTKLKSKNKFSRLFYNLLLGRRLAKASVAWADIIVSMTDPALIGFWIGQELKKTKNKTWLEWEMDIYPEAFNAGNLISKTNPAYLYLLKFLNNNKPDAYIFLGEQQKSFFLKQRNTRKIVKSFILPCGIKDINFYNIPIDETITLAYAGNLGEAHSLEFMETLINLLPNYNFLLKLAINGKHALYLKTKYSDNKNIEWLSHMSVNDLLSCHVHIASLLPEWTHICVPSKALSSICLGKPLLFAGSKSADNYFSLKRAVWFVPLASDGTFDRKKLINCLNQINTSICLHQKTNAAKNLAKTLVNLKTTSIHKIVQYIMNIHKN
jgi:hypothetical protein